MEGVVPLRSAIEARQGAAKRNSVLVDGTFHLPTFHLPKMGFEQKTGLASDPNRVQASWAR
jgi:hypothetical protein